MCGKAWELGKESVTSFINDGALPRQKAHDDRSSVPTASRKPEKRIIVSLRPCAVWHGFLSCVNQLGDT
jgi:hypothetical protein